MLTQGKVLRFQSSRALSRSTVERAAARVREVAGLRAPAVSLLDVLAACPDVLVAPFDLPPGVDVRTLGAQGERAILLPRDVSDELRAVAVAHALAHFVLERDGEGPDVERMCSCGVGGRDLGGDELGLEAACDLFAAELLLPLDELEAAAPDRLFPTAPGAAACFAGEVSALAARFAVPVALVEARLREIADRWGWSEETTAA